MATDKLSVYLQVNGAEEATKRFQRLGKDGMYALNGVTASARPVNSALVAMNSTIGQVNKTMTIKIHNFYINKKQLKSIKTQFINTKHNQ